VVPLWRQLYEATSVANAVRHKRLWPSCSSATASEVCGDTVLQQRTIAAGCRQPPTLSCSWAPGEKEQVTGEHVTVLQHLSPFWWLFGSEWSRRRPMSSILNILEEVGFHGHNKPGMLERAEKLPYIKLAAEVCVPRKRLSLWRDEPHGQGSLPSALFS